MQEAAPHAGAIAMPVFGPDEALAGAPAPYPLEAVAAARPDLAEAAATLTRRLGGEIPEHPRTAAA